MPPNKPSKTNFIIFSTVLDASGPLRQIAHGD
jgi:hypothetical protein